MITEGADPKRLAIAKAGQAATASIHGNPAEVFLTVLRAHGYLVLHVDQVRKLELEAGRPDA